MIKRFAQWFVAGSGFGVGLLAVAFAVSETWPEDTYFSSTALNEMFAIATMNNSMVADRLTFQLELTNKSFHEFDEIGIRIDMFSTDESLVASCKSRHQGIRAERTTWLEIVCERFSSDNLPEWANAKVSALYGKQYAAH